MAYRKKRIVRRRKTYKRKPTLAKKVNILAKQVRAAKPELKYFYSQFSNNGITWDGINVYNFLSTNISEGTNQGERVGNKITPVRFTARGHVRFNQAYEPETQMVRIIVFRGVKEYAMTYTLQSSQDTPNGILTDDSNNSSAAILSPYHWNNRKRFKILMDKTYTFTQGGSQVRMLKWNFKLNGMTTYVDTSGPQIVNNGLYMVAISSAQTDGPPLYLDWRITYTDS